MQERYGQRFQECVLVEINIIDSWFIETIHSIGFFTSILLVEQGKNDDRKTCIEDVIELINEVVKEYHS